MTEYASGIGSVSNVEYLRREDRRLYLGDNLEVMQGMDAGTVDLVYLDPPFNSNKSYKIVFRGPSVLKAEAYLPAFEDIWVWDDASESLYEETVQEHRGTGIAESISGLLKVIGRDRLMAYLVNMTPRLVEVSRLLKPSGSVYMHCDPTASHYLKVIMDAIFGRENFRNEIVWGYRGGGVPRRDFARKHDVILRFSKSGEYLFNPQYTEYSEASKNLVESRGGVSIDARERDLDRGAHMPDWWTDINSLQTWSPERTGYPTQKPLRLLERIIRSSSNEGDLVLDPFCGCGTTMVAAERLRRSWVGIDVEPMALSVLRDRFRRGELNDDFQVKGLLSTKPTDVAAWREFADSDPLRFERAVISQIPNCVPWRNLHDIGEGIDGIVSFTGALSGSYHAIVKVVGESTIDKSILAVLKRILDQRSEDGVVAGVLIAPGYVNGEILREAEEFGMFEIEDRVLPRLSVLSLDELFRRIEKNSALFPLE